jgi:RNA polymerase sigma-70 factor (ECF subfamily)
MAENVAVERELVEALRRGEEAAFAGLVARHHYGFLRIARVWVRDASGAEEVVQKTWLSALESLDRFEGRSSLRTWLYGIALRVASDYRRSAYVRRERAMAEPGEGQEPSTDGEPPAEVRQQLTRLLARLDADRREVVVLYEIEGFTMKEVAEVVGCPLQTAYSRLYSAREQLFEAAKAGKHRG